MKISYLILLCILLSLSANIAFSQNDSLLYQLDILSEKDFIKPVKDETEIISASRSAKKLKDLPVTTYVVTREEIIMNNYVTLVDVVKSLPAIRHSQPGSGDLGEMFQMRGLIGNNYTKILINDIPIKPSVIFGMPISAQLPVRQAERIEITYGPASALYGADAVVGVINIILKEAESGVFAGADINLTGEKYGNFNVGGKIGKDKRIMNYSFYGSIMQKDDWDIYDDKEVFHPLSYYDQYIPEMNIAGNSYLPSELTQALTDQYGITDTLMANFFPYHNYNGTIDSVPLAALPSQSYMLGANFAYKAWEFSFLTMYRKDHSSLGRTPALYKYNNTENYLAETISQSTISWNKNFFALNNKLNASFRSYQLDNHSSFGTTYSTDKEYIYSNAFDIVLEDLLTYKKSFFEIVFGVSLQSSANIPATNYSRYPYTNVKFDFEDLNTEIHVSTSIDSFGYNPNGFGQTSVFAQGYFDFNKIKAMVGIRHDYNSLFNASSINPRIAVLYKIRENTSVRASYAHAFKPPVGNQIFYSIATPGDSAGHYYYAFIPNQNIEPEYFSSFEMGFRSKFWDNKINIDASLYYNVTRNAITLAFVDAAQLGYEYADTDHELARMYVNSNISNTTLMGLDFYIRFQNLIKRFDLKIDIGGTLTDGKETLPNGDEINFTRGVPSVMLKLKTHVKFPKGLYFIINNYMVNGWHRTFLPSANFYENDYYPHIPGYFVTDFILGVQIHKTLNIFADIKNVLGTKYGGIDATSTDADLRYNPQSCNMGKIGLSFIFN